MDPIISIVASMLMSGAAASDGHGCSETAHGSHDACACTRVVDFYGPWTGGGGYTPPGGWGPPVNIPAGPPIYVTSPGVRVYGRPIEVAGPVVYISGPPVYVDAPPIRIAPAQIYVQRPEVHVNPSEIMVEPPQVHFSDCADGTVCTPVGGDSGVRTLARETTPPPVLEADALSSSDNDVRMPVYETTPPPVLETVAPPSSVQPPPPPRRPAYPPKQDRN